MNKIDKYFRTYKFKWIPVQTQIVVAQNDVIKESNTNVSTSTKDWDVLRVYIPHCSLLNSHWNGWRRIKDGGYKVCNPVYLLSVKCYH